MIRTLHLTPLERAVLARIAHGEDPYGPTVSPDGARQIAAVIGRLHGKRALVDKVLPDGSLEYELTPAARAAVETPR